MKKILLATTNKAKIKELKLGLKKLEKYGIKIFTLGELGINKKPEEKGKTFCQNSKIKARFYGNLSGFPTIADDGGLIIPSLNNQPGVRSRRWLGYEASDEELINYTLKKLNNFSKEQRVAYLITCVSFYNPINKDYFFQQKKIKGYIAEKPSGKPTEGYPFRALFIVEKFNKYYDELTEKEHQEVNHRLKALTRLLPFVKNSLNL